MICDQDQLQLDCWVCRGEENQRIGVAGCGENHRNWNKEGGSTENPDSSRGGGIGACQAGAFGCNRPKILDLLGHIGYGYLD